MGQRVERKLLVIARPWTRGHGMALELGTGVDLWLGVATTQRVRCVR